MIAASESRTPLQSAVNRNVQAAITALLLLSEVDHERQGVAFENDGVSRDGFRGNNSIFLI